MVADRRDRGQLLLVGAVAVAFIILGVVVIFNGVLYTQTISAGDSVEGIDDVSTSERELERGIQGYVQRANLDGEGNDFDEFEDEFASPYRNAKTNSRPVIVDVSVENHEEATWVSEDGANNLNLDDEHRIGYFTLTVDSDSDIDVTDTGSNLEVDVSEKDDGDCTVESDEYPVKLDLVRDAADGDLVGDCAFGIGPDGDQYDTIEIDDEDGLVESYDIVLEGDVSGENSNAAWSVDIEYTYDSSDLEFERTPSTIDIYEGEPYHAWPGVSPETENGGEGS